MHLGQWVSDCRLVTVYGQKHNCRNLPLHSTRPSSCLAATKCNQLAPVTTPSDGMARCQACTKPYKFCSTESVLPHEHVVTYVLHVGEGQQADTHRWAWQLRGCTGGSCLLPRRPKGRPTITTDRRSNCIPGPCRKRAQPVPLHHSGHEHLIACTLGNDQGVSAEAHSSTDGPPPSPLTQPTNARNQFRQQQWGSCQFRQCAPRCKATFRAAAGRSDSGRCWEPASCRHVRHPAAACRTQGPTAC